MSVRDSFEALSQRDLAVLVPELLLCGQLIDRSGMAHLIVEFGREGMAQVAVEEWESASPGTPAACRRLSDTRATTS